MSEMSDCLQNTENMVTNVLNALCIRYGTIRPLPLEANYDRINLSGTKIY